MSDAPIDLGDYCRKVEQHLTRTNAGHLVRIVGPAFDVVRQWAGDGIPLGIVFRGIEEKAARHQAGRARRPLHIEHCDADVRAMFDSWQRAIGLAARNAPAKDEAKSRRPSLTQHLDRVVLRLGGLLGRFDLPEAFRDRANQVMSEVAALRDRVREMRGPGRAEIAAALPSIDRELLHAARASAPDETLAPMVREAAAQLAPFRDRLPDDQWQQAIDATIDRLLRERWDLPTILSDDAA